jgi:hypothetical protein
LQQQSGQWYRHPHRQGQLDIGSGGFAALALSLESHHWSLDISCFLRNSWAWPSPPGRTWLYTQAARRATRHGALDQLGSTWAALAVAAMARGIGSHSGIARRCSTVTWHRHPPTLPGPPWTSIFRAPASGIPSGRPWHWDIHLDSRPAAVTGWMGLVVFHAEAARGPPAGRGPPARRDNGADD